MEKDTLIFDLDGTLLNTMGDLHACFNYAIAEFGFPKRSYDEIQSFIGHGVKCAIEQSLPGKVDEKTLDEIIAAFKRYYAEHNADYTKPYDGIVDMLKVLKEKGYKLAVVSNKYDTAVKWLCEKFFSDYITVAIGECEGIDCKPCADGVFKAIELLNSDIEKCVYVGDSDTDILTARNANIPCISVLWGYRDKNFLIKSGAKVFAKEPKEVIEIIEKKLYLI